MSSNTVVQLILCILVPIVTVSFLCRNARLRGSVPGWNVAIWASLLTAVLFTLHVYLFGERHAHVPDVAVLILPPVGFVGGVLPAILTLAVLRR